MLNRNEVANKVDEWAITFNSLESHVEDQRKTAKAVLVKYICSTYNADSLTVFDVDNIFKNDLIGYNTVEDFDRYKRGSDIEILSKDKDWIEEYLSLKDIFRILCGYSYIYHKHIVATFKRG